MIKYPVSQKTEATGCPNKFLKTRHQKSFKSQNEVSNALKLTSVDSKLVGSLCTFNGFLDDGKGLFFATNVCPQY